MNIYLLWGWFASMITFVLTVMLNNVLQIKELNPVMSFLLSNTYYLIIVYGVIWAIIFTMYNYYQNDYIGNYISYLCCFIFTFDLIHDLITLYRL